jgi:hypothetical protein
MLTKPLFPRNEPLLQQSIVVCSVTRNKITFLIGIAIENGEHEIMINPTITDSLIVRTQTGIVDLLIQRPGNKDMSNKLTNQKG